MDAIFELGPMTTVTILSSQITGEISLRSLTVAGEDAYLLDDNGRIIAVPLSATAPPLVVYEDGVSYGGTPAERPLYMTWEGDDASGRLLVLDAERKLFEVRPGSEPTLIPLRRTGTWASVGGIAAYDSNFYVLDPAASQVHRYLPAAVGFDSEPSPAISAAEALAEAQGLAVDGDILVYANDGLRRFRSGAEAGFDLGGIDRPPEAITAVAMTEEEVYIADSGNNRIIVATREGEFARQLVSTEFTDLRSMAVDPTGAQLYVVVGDALLTAPIVR
jgi:hypothetical protein